MSKRVPASMRTRESLRRLIEGEAGTADGRGDLVKLATRLILEAALEAEPGRGWRNGVRTGRLKTAEGFVEYAAPQITGREEPIRSEIRERLQGRTQALEDLAVELLARGLSVRGIEDVFKDETGRLLLSRTAVSEIGERLWADYQEFASRDLGEYDVAYLFIDGVAERIRPGSKREPVLAAWGFTAGGSKVLLHLMAGSKEDAETVGAFFQDMRHRGLGDPLLVVSDGAPGIVKAIETCFPRSARQRCLAHRMRNLVAKVPDDAWPEFKGRVTAAYQAPSRAWCATTPRSSRARSGASKTTSRRASRTSGCRSTTAARSGPRICSSACSWRNAGASRCSPMRSASAPSSSSCSLP